MPGLGLSEILLLVVLILMFVRTEDLPKIMRFLGRMWAKGYRYYLMFKQEMRRMEKSMGIEEEMKDIRSINARLNSEIASFNREIREDNYNNEKKSEQKIEEQVKSTQEKE